MAATIPFGSLTTAQGDLLRETETARLAELDEDELLALHARIAPGPQQVVGLYRRQGAARVTAKGARGKARPANRTQRRAGRGLRAGARPGKQAHRRRRTGGRRGAQGGASRGRRRGHVRTGPDGAACRRRHRHS